jgi:hypothetical protein
MIRAAFALIAVSVAACAQTPPSLTPPGNAEEATALDTCGVARFASLVGRQADQIDRSTLPARTRFITPDAMVTQDFSPERLNVFVGTDGRVGSLRCF